MEDAFDATLAVVADDELRDARLRERGQAGLEGREDRQLDQAEKERRADHVIRNDASLRSWMRGESADRRTAQGAVDEPEHLGEIRAIALEGERGTLEDPPDHPHQGSQGLPAPAPCEGDRRDAARRRRRGISARQQRLFPAHPGEVTLPLQHEDIIRQQARDKDVPADLIAAVIYNESRFSDQTSPPELAG